MTTTEVNKDDCESSFTPIIKRYRISFKEKSKARMHITPHLDALIYFYPNGLDGKSKLNYCASDVQLQELEKQDIHNHQHITFVWKCRNQKQIQTCSIRKYLENSDKALGFHSLFSMWDVIKAEGIIKVTCTIKSAYSKRKGFEKKNNIKPNCPKKRKLKQTTLPYAISRPVKKPRFKITKSLQNDMKLNHETLIEALTLFSDMLNMEDLSGVRPTIDCFTYKLSINM